MKIITVNLPLSYLKMIDGLTGEKNLFPSRSELIRVAVREFLIRELEAAKSFTSYQSVLSKPGTFSNQHDIDPMQNPTPEMDPNLFVQIPLGSTSNGVPEYKTFRLVKK